MMSATAQATIQKAATLDVSGEGRATATVAFEDRGDLDRDGFAPESIREKKVPLHRGHESILGVGILPPFGVAHIRRHTDRYIATIDFFKTERGREEHETAKALHAAGVPQPVSIGFRIEATGPVPEHLRGTVHRYITRAELFELSLVTLGAIPGAALTSVKACGCRADSPCGCARSGKNRLTRADQARLREIEAQMKTRERKLHYLLEAPPRVSIPRLQAERLADLASFGSKVLELDPPPRVVYFEAVDDDDRAGFCDCGDSRNLVWVRASLSGAQKAAVLTHELAHAADFTSERNASEVGDLLLASWLRARREG
jgi:hypothetical protein